MSLKEMRQGREIMTPAPGDSQGGASWPLDKRVPDKRVRC